MVRDRIAADQVYQWPHGRSHFYMHKIFVAKESNSASLVYSAIFGSSKLISLQNNAKGVDADLEKFCKMASIILPTMKEYLSNRWFRSVSKPLTAIYIDRFGVDLRHVLEYLPFQLVGNCRGLVLDYFKREMFRFQADGTVPEFLRRRLVLTLKWKKRHEPRFLALVRETFSSHKDLDHVVRQIMERIIGFLIDLCLYLTLECFQFAAPTSDSHSKNKDSKKKDPRKRDSKTKTLVKVRSSVCDPKRSDSTSIAPTEDQMSNADEDSNLETTQYRPNIDDLPPPNDVDSACQVKTSNYCTTSSSANVLPASVEKKEPPSECNAEHEQDTSNHSTSTAVPPVSPAVQSSTAFNRVDTDMRADYNLNAPVLPPADTADSQMVTDSPTSKADSVNVLVKFETAEQTELPSANICNLQKCRSAEATSAADSAPSLEHGSHSHTNSSGSEFTPPKPPTDCTRSVPIPDVKMRRCPPLDDPNRMSDPSASITTASTMESPKKRASSLASDAISSKKKRPSGICKVEVIDVSDDEDIARVNVKPKPVVETNALVGCKPNIRETVVSIEPETDPWATSVFMMEADDTIPYFYKLWFTDLLRKNKQLRQECGFEANKQIDVTSSIDSVCDEYTVAEAIMVSDSSLAHFYKLSFQLLIAEIRQLRITVSLRS